MRMAPVVQETSRLQGFDGNVGKLRHRQVDIEGRPRLFAVQLDGHATDQRVPRTGPVEHGNQLAQRLLLGVVGR